MRQYWKERIQYVLLLPGYHSHMTLEVGLLRFEDLRPFVMPCCSRRLFHRNLPIKLPISLKSALRSSDRFLASTSVDSRERLPYRTTYSPISQEKEQYITQCPHFGKYQYGQYTATHNYPRHSTLPISILPTSSSSETWLQLPNFRPSRATQPVISQTPSSS